MEIGNRNSYSYRRIKIPIEGLSSGSFFFLGESFGIWIYSILSMERIWWVRNDVGHRFSFKIVQKKNIHVSKENTGMKILDSSKYYCVIECKTEYCKKDSWNISVANRIYGQFLDGDTIAFRKCLRLPFIAIINIVRIWKCIWFWEKEERIPEKNTFSSPSSSSSSINITS